MHEAAAVGGEWISVWLSPLAYLILDVLVVALIFVAGDLFVKVLRRVRRRG